MPKLRNKIRPMKDENFNGDDIDMFDDIDKYHLQKEINLSFDKSDIEVEPVFGIESSEDEHKDDDSFDEVGNLENGDLLDTDSNEEEENDSDDEVSRNFWGTKKSAYYNSDSTYIEVNTKGSKGERKSKQQREMEKKELLKMEEEEALVLQRQMMQELKDEDFGLDYFREMSQKFASEKLGANKDVKGILDSTTFNEFATHLPRDLSSFTTKHKKRLLSKESPELIAWGLEAQNYIAEMDTFLNPFLNAYTLVNSPQIILKKEKESSIALKAINPNVIKVMSMRRHVISLYLVNFAYYLYIKAKSNKNHGTGNDSLFTLNVYAHPVIVRLKAYKKLLDTMESKVLGQHRVSLQTLLSSLSPLDLSIDVIEGRVGKYKLNEKSRSFPLGYHPSECHTHRSEDAFDKALHETLRGTATLEQQQLSKNSKSLSPALPSALTRPINKNITQITRKGHGRHANIKKHVAFVEPTFNSHEAANETDGKRAINYEIAKNKGLTPKRKKEYRNPRVKHKIRFRKALIKRKSQVRIPKSEIPKYGGEMTGIKVGLKRSIKIR